MKHFEDAGKRNLLNALRNNLYLDKSPNLEEANIDKRVISRKVQDFRNWKASGTELIGDIVKNTKESRHFLEHLIYVETKRLYDDVKEAEIKTNLKAFMGFAVSHSDFSGANSNAILYPMMNIIIKMGRIMFKKGGDGEKISLPTYLKMIGDYYSHFEPDKSHLWVSATNSEAAIANWHLENEPLWLIVAQCIAHLGKNSDTA